MDSDFDYDAAIQSDQDAMDLEGSFDEEDLDEESVCDGIEVADALYTNPLNSNNMSRSLKIVDVKDVQELGESDGYLYAFLSEAEGPMLSSMCQKQILVIMHVLNSPICPSHVVRTKTLNPVFSKGEGVLEKLMETMDEASARDVDGYNEAVGGAVGDIPFDLVCDFRDNAAPGERLQRVASVGEILVAPVTAKYTVKVNLFSRMLHCAPKQIGNTLLVQGRELRKTYWMVILKTRRCYDFAGHIFSMVMGNSKDEKSKRKMGAPNNDKVMEMMYEVRIIDHSALHLYCGNRLETPAGPLAQGTKSTPFCAVFLLQRLIANPCRSSCTSTRYLPTSTRT